MTPIHYLGMARGKQVSEDLAWVVVWLPALFPINEVSTFTGLSMQMIHDIAALHASTGDPVKHSDHKRGRKRALTATEVDVSCTKIFPQCCLSTHSSFYMVPSATTMTPTLMSCRNSSTAGADMWKIGLKKHNLEGFAMKWVYHEEGKYSIVM